MCPTSLKPPTLRRVALPTPGQMRTELWLSQLQRKGPQGGAPTQGEYYDLLFEVSRSPAVPRRAALLLPCCCCSCCTPQCTHTVGTLFVAPVGACRRCRLRC